MSRVKLTVSGAPSRETFPSTALCRPLYKTWHEVPEPVTHAFINPFVQQITYVPDTVMGTVGAAKVVQQK